MLFSELNRDYVRRSLENAPADKFEIGFYDDGHFPESELESLCEIFDILNTAPRGELEMNDWKMTPEKLLEFMEQGRKHGNQNWMLYARDKANGRYAGFSDTNWHPNRSFLVWQGATCRSSRFSRAWAGRLAQSHDD
jgi:mycothiol synthase